MGIGDLPCPVQVGNGTGNLDDALVGDDQILDNIDQLRPRLETAGFSVRGRRLTRNDVLAASEVLVLGSGMGVRALRGHSLRRMFGVNQKELMSDRVIPSPFWLDQFNEPG